MTKITLENMEFHAYHGCLEHEKTIGNTFIVSVAMGIDTSRAAQTDDLNDTLNYQLVYDAVKAEMDIPSQLIEHLIARITDRIFNSFHQIQTLHVKLSKLNPPLGAKVANVTIETTKSRN